VTVGVSADIRTGDPSSQLTPCRVHYMELASVSGHAELILCEAYTVFVSSRGCHFDLNV
jgi:hypothetical protein